MHKKILACMCALSCVFAFTACGDKENAEDSKVDDSKAEIVTADEDIAKTTDGEDTESSDEENVTSEEDEITLTKDVITEEEVLELADKALKAYAELDLEGMYELTTLRYLFSENGEDVDFETFKANMDDILEDSGIEDSEYNYELSNAEVDLTMLESLNTAIIDSADNSFSIDGCWRVTGTTDYGEGILYVLHIGDSWKADMVFTIYGEGLEDTPTIETPTIN